MIRLTLFLAANIMLIVFGTSRPACAKAPVSPSHDKNLVHARRQLQNHTKSPYSNHQVTNRSAFQSKVKPNEPIGQSGASSHLGQNTDAEKFTKGQSETLMGVDQETNF